jgi:hypothetical protein
LDSPALKDWWETESKSCRVEKEKEMERKGKEIQKEKL